MPKALYRKYRSKKLSEVIGQEHVTDVLARAIALGKVSHAYLLTGPRGVGKTSVARILAHEINGLEYLDETTHLDIIEIDAASNNGVDDVRELREKVQIAPVSASKKIYIIDEVHMLSKAAFNALLKTLEEPPEHIVFIMATTNAEKIPATIISRTQRFSFKPIKKSDIIKHLKNIADKENININLEALDLIASRGDGSFRDSISLLDQLSSLVDEKKEITVELIESTLGLASQTIIDDILSAVENHKLEELIKTLNSAFDNGATYNLIVSQLMTTLSQEIAQKPSLLPLLDSLIDVEKSPQPQLKLLSVLGSAASPKSSVKSAALVAQPREIVVPIAELEAQAVKDSPAENIPVETTPIQNPKTPVSVLPKPKKTKQNTTSSPITDFDFNKLLQQTKANCIAVYSVLSKCSYEIKDNQLIIYTLNKFYKSKLDDVKYRPLLSKCLEDIGNVGVDIQTIPTQAPPKDSQAAAIAAIMGGGVEVSLETAS